MNDLKNLGYSGTLAILPFDHREFLIKEFGLNVPLSPADAQQLTDAKQLIYEGYLHALEKNFVTKENSAILVDDTFGKNILIDAKSRNIMVLQSTEKSGVDYFEFEHGDEWQNWISEVKPTFVKALVRYNVEGNAENNKKSLEGLARLSKFAHENNYKFLIEPLVPATDEQLAAVGNDPMRYDNELRADLTVRMIAEMQDANVEPDIWKIEGFDKTSDYGKVISVAQANGQNNVAIIILGRGQDENHVEDWINAGKHVPGVKGFAVGRTVFLQALLDFREGKISREIAIETIANNFEKFVKLFSEK